MSLNNYALSSICKETFHFDSFDCVHKSVLVILDIILFQVIYYRRQKRIEKQPNLEDDKNERKK